MPLQSAVVVGVGSDNGLGAALCRRIARERYHVYAVGRTHTALERVVTSIVETGGSAEAIVGDVTCEADVAAIFDKAMSTSGDFEPPALVIYNAGNNKQILFNELSVSDFESFLRVGPLGAFLVGREVANRIVPLGRGTLIFTGASASLRGKPGYAHFAASKAGVRMISQSMAREYGPRGLHVAHAVIDGGIDGEKFLTSRPEIAAARGENGLLKTNAIAEAYWQIHKQHPSAWTQEIDLRPFKEVY